MDFLPSRGVLLAAALIASGCGGDGSPASPSYPVAKGIYGSYSGLPPGASVWPRAA